MASMMRLAAFAALLFLPACASLAGAQAEPAQRILIAGDSTAADYPPDRAPQVGWGQALPFFLAEGVGVANLAVNGRSTKSYIDEGRWDTLIAQVQPGDVVLISFGHNDSRDDAPERYAAPFEAYTENMQRFAREVQAAGRRAIIVSPAARRLWEGPAMVETHGLYAYAARLAADETGAGFIDLSNLSLAWFEPIGREATKQDYLWVTRPHWQTGEIETLEDNTHFSWLGACGLAYVLSGQPELEAVSRRDIVFGALPVDGERPAIVRDCEASLAG